LAGGSTPAGQGTTFGRSLSAVNYNEVRFPRRGRYVMVCFFEGHNSQGMYKFVRVR
jgi:hypothetical protein